MEVGALPDYLATGIDISEFNGDVNMAALNHIRAWEGVDEDKLEWMPGKDASVFETDQAVCVLTEQCAARFGVELGGEVSVAVYAVRRKTILIALTAGHKACQHDT